MIFALLFLLLGGSGDSTLQALLDVASDRVSVVVGDKARQDELEIIFATARDATDRFEKTRRDLHENWIKLGKQGTGAETASYAELFESITVNGNIYQQAMIEQRMKLRDTLSKEEWAEIFPTGE